MDARTFQQFIGSALTVRQWLLDLHSPLESPCWLLMKDDDIAGDNTRLQLDHLLYPVTDEADQLSDDEFDAFETAMAEQGFGYFLDSNMLEDVICNYRMQKALLCGQQNSEPHCTEQELLDAAWFYFKRDAFVVLESAGADC